MNELTGLIVCGGRGRRLGPLGGLLHKTLFPVAGAPILVHVVRAVLSTVSCRRIIFLTGHLAWQIERVVDAYAPSVDVEFIQDNSASGTADAVCRAVRKLGLERFIYAHGNVVVGEESLLRLRSASKRLTDADSLLAVSHAAIAPTHPTLRIPAGDVDPTPSGHSAPALYSVGFGIIQGTRRCLMDEVRPPGCSLEDYLFSAEGSPYSLKAVDIGADWCHLEDLTFYSS